MSVRVRFGPSPTGELHVGGLRTALFDWLFARHHGGVFILRIEDTDQKRTVPGAEDRIMQGLRWLGLDWDEGPDIGGPHAPYRQSERLPSYQAAATQLLASGHAYRCACSSERLDRIRKAKQQAKRPPGYDGHCRTLSDTEITEAIAEQGGRSVVRFKMPHEGATVVPDALRGDVVFENRLLDDHVLLKADGFPTYHLASVVDDHAMQISHVFRGDEWLPSAPRHLLLYHALGYQPPIFVHQPIILGPDKGKLSKRHGATSVLEYADRGYLPEALINFLVLLGWSKDDHTTKMSLDEIVAAFDIDRMGVTPTTFDHQRLDAMNADFLRDLTPQQFFDRARPFLDRLLPADIARPLALDPLLPLAPLIQERVKLLPEVADYVDFFLTPGPLDYANAELMGKGFRDNPAGALAAVDGAREALLAVDPWTTEGIEAALRGLAERLQLKPGVVFTPLRVAVTGKRIAPPLFETLTVLGPDRVSERLNLAAQRLARPDD
ncbi:MAG: glutamyl-tRNA synthetase [Chloroflexi bacterium]|nr:MAG: glutamyl-tRNA synthetase [Chloroflexota bacterium]